MMTNVFHMSDLRHDRAVVPRILVDFLLTQLAAVLALGLPVLYVAASGDGAHAVELARSSRDYYRSVFFPLSAVFPVVFFLNGFYTGPYGYEGRYKPLLVLRGVVASVAVFLIGSYVISAPAPAPPSAGVVICATILAMAASVRLVKAVMMIQVSRQLEDRYRTSESGGELILVIGGAGYIGSTLVRQLLDAGHRVRILDSMIYGDHAIQDIMTHPQLEVRVGDCRNIAAVIDAVRGVSSIVHLAAIVGDPACDLDHQTAREINYAATCMILEVAKGQKVSRFIFASSCSVYGATDQMMYESSATVPLSVYAQTKLDSEAAVLAAADSTFHPTVMRLATVFGNSWRPRFDLVVNLLTGKAHAEGVITIYNGEQWRPFIHVADVSRGVRTMLDAPVDAISGRIFNLGDSRLNYTLTNVAEHIRTAFPNTTVHIVDNSDRRNYRVSFERARTILGFECKYDLDDGIRELKAALENGQIADYTSPRYHNQQYLKATGSPATRSPIDAKVMAAFASAASQGSQAFTTA